KEQKRNRRREKEETCRIQVRTAENTTGKFNKQGQQEQKKRKSKKEKGRLEKIKNHKARGKETMWKESMNKKQK
ncbi:20116_t:CDS:1, partial [Funneliformis geosporum]